MIDVSVKKSLKAQAHHLKPVIIIGSKGLTEALIAETDNALMTHELMKVKINGAERDERLLMANELCEKVRAEFIQLIGNTLILYRKKPENPKNH